MLKAEEIMSKSVATIRGSATTAEAVKLMKDKGVQALIVEPRSEADPYGILTETDLVIAIRESATVAEVLKLMKD